MCNKTCHRFLLIWMMACWLYVPLYGQNAVLRITESTLNQGSAAVTAAGYNYQTGIGLLPTLTIATSSSNLSGASGDIPVGRLTATVVKDNVDKTTVTLSPNEQTLNGSILGALSFSSGFFSMRYSAPSLATYAWRAGTYNTNLNFKVHSLAIGTSITPAVASLSVVVDPFISFMTNPTALILPINTLDYFRNGFTGSSFAPFNMKHTLPLSLSLSTNSNQFIFSNGNPNIVSPQSFTSAVKYQLISPASSSAIGLSSNLTNLYTGSTIPVGNNTAFNQKLTISAADLQSHFINKGTYTTTLNYQLSNSSGTPVFTNTKSAELRIVVSDLLELQLNTSVITLPFRTAVDYQQGVSTDVSNHLVISATIPYSVQVRSSTSSFVAGTNTLPASILNIGAASGQDGVQSISELATTEQSLIPYGQPVIDRPVHIKYRIPPTKTTQLLNKKAATYSTNVIYTLTAL